MSLTECQVSRPRKKSVDRPCPLLFKFFSIEEPTDSRISGTIKGSSTPYINITIVPDLTPYQTRCYSEAMNADKLNRTTVDDVLRVISSSDIPDERVHWTS
ncbi:unnamed protein product [Trichobilharzia regenti]|nr:unnamed protein product [Trichobilharzia regenti]